MWCDVMWCGVLGVVWSVRCGVMCRAWRGVLGVVRGVGCGVKCRAWCEASGAAQNVVCGVECWLRREAPAAARDPRRGSKHQKFSKINGTFLSGQSSKQKAKSEEYQVLQYSDTCSMRRRVPGATRGARSGVAR